MRRSFLTLASLSSATKTGAGTQKQSQLHLSITLTFYFYQYQFSTSRPSLDSLFLFTLSLLISCLIEHQLSLHSVVTLCRSSPFTVGRLLYSNETHGWNTQPKSACTEWHQMHTLSLMCSRVLSVIVFRLRSPIFLDSLRGSPVPSATPLLSTSRYAGHAGSWSCEKQTV